ncbi:SSI family serine proteinase inhibitor [Streptomyces goshikiensis]|uniref:SSI family serine proteinase inhibitor n=1 Tax=Streptomyces goshikiensis TaxID=1942 RepID=UPI0037D2B46A
MRDTRRNAPPARKKPAVNWKPSAGASNPSTSNQRPSAMVYAPETATATGTWRGTPVKWQKTYANECQLISETGHVLAASATGSIPLGDPGR